MKKIKRDQRPYELVQQHLPDLILNTILKIVEDLGDPYQAKPGLGGITAYPPKAMTVVCIFMEAEARTYRKMVGHLRMNRGLAMKIGLPKIPSKSTIWRAYGMIPEGSFELLGPSRLSATSAILSTPADPASCSDTDLPHLQVAVTA